MTSHHRDPTTLLRTPPVVRPVTSPGCTLVIIAGPEVGRQFTVEDVSTRRVLIGQSVACDVQLGDRAVSRRHAALEMDSAGLRVTDLDSTNGTWVNSVRIRDAYLPARGSKRSSASARPRCASTSTRPLTSSLRPKRRASGRSSARAPRCSGSTPSSPSSPAAPSPSSSRGRPGRARRCSPSRSTRRARAARVRSWSSIVRPSHRRSSKRSSSATSAARSRAPRRRGAGCSKRPTEGRCSSTRSGSSTSRCKSSCSARSRSRRCGASGRQKWTKVNVRVLAATRRDLDREVQARRFRDDLFYRLAVVRVELPPLRKRQGDVGLLARVFWITLGGDETKLPPDLLLRYGQYGWPGNVRELHNAVARRLAIGDDGLFEELLAENASATSREDFIEAMVSGGVPLPLARQQMLQAFEHRYIERMLKLHGGNVSRAAQASGIGRRHFQMIKAKR